LTFCAPLADIHSCQKADSVLVSEQFLIKEARAALNLMRNKEGDSSKASVPFEDEIVSAMGKLGLREGDGRECLNNVRLSISVPR
jgi:hypothetical protein